MGNLENYHENPDENPPPPETTPETAGQPNSQAQLGNLTSEIVEPALTPEKLVVYMRDQLIKNVETALANSGFHTNQPPNGWTFGYSIRNQQDELLAHFSIDRKNFAYFVEGGSKYDIETQVFKIFPPKIEKGRSEQSYAREAAKKAAEAALERAKLVDAAIQKEKQSAPDKP